MAQQVSPSPVVPGPSTVSPGVWTIAPTRSTAAIAVRNFGLKTVRGTVSIRQATVGVDHDGRIESAQAALNLSAISTGNARRDKDLAKQKLLNTKDFPTLGFTSTHAANTDAGWQVQGSIQARGMSTPVVLEVILAGGSAKGPLTVRARTRFDRRTLGVRAPRFMIGRWIEVQIDAVFELTG